jgi:hypothetical protein
MVISFSQEHEDMNLAFSSVTMECVVFKNKYVALDAKFKEYYSKSSKHIAESEKKLEELQTELKDMHHRHSNSE